MINIINKFGIIMGNIYSWAEQECRLACKRENPNFDFDSDDFDYGCSCYKSALKAYKSLVEDEHSGMSFSFTRDILERLMRHEPLTPITDDDFEGGNLIYSDEDLASMGLKSEIQCPRMSSLFRKETLDGKITYCDVDRAYCVDVESPSDTFSCGRETNIVDEMFPIQMPYLPEKGEYKVYVQTFLTDKKNGDFDTQGVLYLITPDGKRIDINRFYTEKNGKMVEISKEEYDELLEKRLYKISDLAADNILWTLISNSSSDEEIESREKMWKSLSSSVRNDIESSLREMCVFFENPENYKYNIFDVRQNLCRGNFDSYKDVNELVKIGEFLQDILKLLK